MPAPGEVTQILHELQNGDPTAEERLIPHVYGELRRLASHYMRRERSDHTLQATALVHEAYLKLIDQHEVNWQGRAHFLGIAAQLMRRILVDHARSHHAVKRGGEQQRIPLDDVIIFSESKSSELIALDEALSRLAQIDARQSRIVELRFFAGLSVEETAEVLSISPKTVKRDWSVARAWLHREISKGSDHASGAMGSR
jgi:RNA polymerase sigma-70 factor, ECF subfamily